MAISNIYLQEAVESSGVKPAQIAADLKKLMQTCRLTKFSSKDSCAKVYSAIFMNALENEQDPTVEEWGIIYNTLLTDQTFIDNMCLYLAMYHPTQYAGMFDPLFNKMRSELRTHKKHRVSYIGTAKAILGAIQLRFDAMRAVIVPQTYNNQETITFLTAIDQKLQDLQFKLQTELHHELETATDKDDIQPTVTPVTELEEDAREIIHLLEQADTWISNYIANDPLNEAIVSNAVERAKAAKVKMDKAAKAFDEFVMKKFHKMQTDRRNRKHSEMVGESLRIMHEIKRLLASGGIAIFSPALGVITWVVTLLIDKRTDKKDRAVLVGMLKDELEIIDEKISMAERNGDDKAKIDLIRYRQKLYKEYERINKVTFDKARTMQTVHG